MHCTCFLKARGGSRKQGHSAGSRTRSQWQFLDREDMKAFRQVTTCRSPPRATERVPSSSEKFLCACSKRVSGVLLMGRELPRTCLAVLQCNFCTAASPETLLGSSEHFKHCKPPLRSFAWAFRAARVETTCYCSSLQVHSSECF